MEGVDFSGGSGGTGGRGGGATRWRVTDKIMQLNGKITSGKKAEG